MEIESAVRRDDDYVEPGVVVFCCETTPACFSAAIVCCNRLNRSTAAVDVSTSRQAGYRLASIGVDDAGSGNRGKQNSNRSVWPSQIIVWMESAKVSANSGRST